MAEKGSKSKRSTEQNKISFYLEQKLHNFIDSIFGNKNRLIKHSLSNFISKNNLFLEPSGLLPYIFVINEKVVQGVLEYDFGVYPEASRKFLIVRDVEGTLLKMIIESKSQTEFLSLCYLLNYELNLGYNAFNNNKVDLLVLYNNEFKEIAIEYVYSARLNSLGDNYHEFLQCFTSKGKYEKIEFLKQNMEDFLVGDV